MICCSKENMTYMQTKILLTMLMVSFLFFGCEKEEEERKIASIYISDQSDVDKLADATIAKQLSNLEFDVRQGSDLDLSILKHVENVLNLEIKGGEVKLNQLESLTHVGSFRINAFEGSEISLPAVKTMHIMDFNTAKKELKQLTISFPSLESVSERIFYDSYSDKEQVENLTLDFPKLEYCKRFVARKSIAHMDIRLPSIKSIDRFRLSYASLKGTISDDLVIKHHVGLYASDGLANWDWLKNSFGTTKSYLIFHVQPSDLCFLLPVASTEPLRIRIGVGNERYYGDKIVEECK